MDRESPYEKTDWEKISLIALIALGVVLLSLLLWTVAGGSTTGAQVKTTSDLISTRDIANLSVSEFVYNGIAQTLKEDGNPDFNVLYKSTVKVSIDAEGIKYTVGEEKKTITFFFPEFTIEKPVIDVDSISVIPTRHDLEMDDVIKLCRSDALAEATKSDKLISCAKDNLKSIMEAWYTPVLEGYTFIYEFNAAEGGESE